VEGMRKAVMELHVAWINSGVEMDYGVSSPLSNAITGNNIEKGLNNFIFDIFIYSIHRNDCGDNSDEQGCSKLKRNFTYFNGI
jgi:hypothetical protein